MKFPLRKVLRRVVMLFQLKLLAYNVNSTSIDKQTICKVSYIATECQSFG